MTTKKDLNLKSKKELVDLLYDAQSFYFTLERELSHEIYQDALEEMYFEALDGEISQADFFGATRFANKFNTMARERIQKLAGYHRVTKLINDDRFDFGNWYTPIDIFKDKKKVSD